MPPTAVATAQAAVTERLHQPLFRTYAPHASPGISRLRPLCASLAARLLHPSGHALMLDLQESARQAPIRAETVRFLALILTELVNIAADHAFPDGAPGQVSVTVLCRDEQVVCTMRDDGAGALPHPGGAMAQRMDTADRLATLAGGRCRWVFTRSGTDIELLLPLAPAPREPAQPLRPRPIRGAWRRLFEV